jgi:hypothetical protein
VLRIEEHYVNPVVVLYLIGFGSVGIGWLLGHGGEPAEPADERRRSRTILSRALYGLGFLISGMGTTIAFEVAANSSQYGVIP